MATYNDGYNWHAITREGVTEYLNGSYREIEHYCEEVLGMSPLTGYRTLSLEDVEELEVKQNFKHVFLLLIDYELTRPLP